MRKILGVLFGLLILFVGVPAFAQEQWCSDYPSACLCSETFNVSSFTSNGNYRQPTETNDKKCGFELADYPVYTYGDFSMSNDATALAAMPNRQGVNYFARRGAGHDGMWLTGDTLHVSGSNYLARTSMRWYRYASPDFDWGSNISPPSGFPCQQSGKFVEGWDGVNGLATTNHGDGMTMYNFLVFSPPHDCCYASQMSNPTYGQVGNVFLSPSMNGKWWRFEQVTVNRGGPGVDIITYAKNVTDNQAEFEAYRVSAIDWYTSSLTPPGPRTVYSASMYRQVDDTYPGGGACAGWAGISHFVLAGWSTNAGQRIGGAVEVEGDGGPLPPSSGVFTIWSVSQIFMILVPLLFGTAGIVLGLLALGRKVRRRVLDIPYTPPATGGDLEQPSRVTPLDGPTPVYGNEVERVDAAPSPAETAEIEAVRR